MEEANLAIDIQLKKLLDWLVSRRICNRSWHENILAVREKIGMAIGDMPEHPRVKELLSGTNINYFHCLQIVDILKETEADSMNFFGSYGSQRMKDWQEVIKLYQRDQIYLPEAAQLLSQAVTYEIPGLKKQLTKSIQIQGDCDKKEKDNAKKARDFRSEFDKSCKQLGIEGVKIRREIIALLSNLPETYAKMADDARALSPAVEAYVTFLESTLDEAMFKREDVLPTLSFLMAKGNVTTYEWMHGEPPLSVEEPMLDFGEDEKEDEAGGDAIDFGEDGGIDFGDSGGDGIDFGGDGDVDIDSGADIDWGNLGSGDDAAGTADIDWSAADAEVVDITVEDGGVSGGIARDSEALSLLDNRRTRTLILDELTELDCFLGQRLAEIEAQDAGKFTVGGGSNLNESPDKYERHRSDIVNIVSTLTAGKLHHLQLIRSSPSYVDRLVDNLKRKLSLVDKMELSTTTVGEKREEAIGEQAAVQRRLELVKGKTKELQGEIERDISGRYKGRPVNIMGGVQSV
jgi:hypothetical protein